MSRCGSYDVMRREPRPYLAGIVTEPLRAARGNNSLSCRLFSRKVTCAVAALDDRARPSARPNRSRAMPSFPRIAPCLWFDRQAEEAAKLYTGIFKNSRILRTTHYGPVGQEIHGMQPGTVMTVDFELEGQRFTALNGGPVFRFNEAISLQVFCDTQEDVDHYWSKLSAGGDPEAQQCGWLKDKYGLSWQVVPKVLLELVADPESERSQRATAAMLKMKKFDIAKLKAAAEGQPAT
jgi:predicted 3-demethylubiquinone-9 3-methyltransferase (glyoxalase superfamily)